jgi:hypothetical protein
MGGPPAPGSGDRVREVGELVGHTIYMSGRVSAC